MNVHVIKTNVRTFEVDNLFSHFCSRCRYAKVFEGHSKAILNCLDVDGRLLGFDQDTDAFKNVLVDSRFDFIHSNFSNLSQYLKYHKAIPVAGGIYLIHVDVPGVGERVLKFFGGMRQSDLQGI